MHALKGHLVFVSVFVCLLTNTALGDTLTKEFPLEVSPVVSLAVRPFELSDVQLLDGPFKEAMDHNAEWLLDLEPDRFLGWFRKEAGMEPKGEVYGGWEQNTIAGHCLGHYMSAIAMMYAETGNEEFKKRAAYIVDELAAVQDANGSGYMSAFPGGKKAFEEIRQGEIRSQGFDLNGIWVPWYTQHKLMAGLRDIYHYTDNPKALAVWKRHADWIIDVTANLTDELWQKMLDCEHGGMNELLADLYGITGEKKYLELAEHFYDESILDPLSQRQDCLSGLHANTQIPKMIGAARLYEMTGKQKYETIADFFWTTVVDHYTYINGGNSSQEHFGKPDMLGEQMRDTTETCNTYNMLKLTRHLFTWEPTAKYMDYYERALLNHILAHQHPEQGGRLVYKGFLDMPARKEFSHPTQSFWCCVGTGMENHTKYADTIYMYNEEALYVNLFVSSKLTWQDKGITLTQKSQLPQEGTVTLDFECEKPVELTLKIRKPYWTRSVSLSVNGQPQGFSISKDGYINIKRTFENNDKVTVMLPLSVHVSTVPDMPRRTAFLYGPTLLAALLEEGQNMPMIVSEDTNTLLQSFEKEEGLEFKLAKKAYVSTEDDWQQRDLELIPLFEIAEQPYTVYMDVYTPEQWQQKQAEYAAEQERRQRIEASTVDVISLGRMQAERDHNLESERSNVGILHDRGWRDSSGGWFEFDMKVSDEKPVNLICTYWGSDGGQRNFDILVDGTKIATQQLNQNQPGDFFEVVYPVPNELTKGKDKVRVRFQAHPDNTAGGVFEVRIIKRDTDGPARDS